MNRRHCLAALGGATLRGQQKLSPYYPSPEVVVEKMLQLAEIKPGETVYDLGSGDGRIVIMAAQKYGAKAIGVELDKNLAGKSAERIRALGISQTARIIQGDMLEQDYTGADVITIYLLPFDVERVRPLFEKYLRKGGRVVAHDFEVKGWTPIKSETVLTSGDDDGPEHRLFLYRR